MDNGVCEENKLMRNGGMGCDRVVGGNERKGWEWWDEGVKSEALCINSDIESKRYS